MSFYSLFKPRDSLLVLGFFWFFSFSFMVGEPNASRQSGKILLCIAQSKSGLKPLQHLEAQCVPCGSILWMVGLWSCSSRCSSYL